jgi:aromatic ring-opening dioxygenase catalytic subunit (LigB family)
MLYALGLQQEAESVEWLYEGFQYANISMRCFRIS